jgi:hypothetical protein
MHDMLSYQGRVCALETMSELLDRR